MKIVRHGFTVKDISAGITDVAVDSESDRHPPTFSILSKCVVTGNGEQSQSLPLSDLTALIEALQEVKRITDAGFVAPTEPSGPRVTAFGDVEPPAEPERVVDRDGATWVRGPRGMYSMEGGASPIWNLQTVDREYGPLKPVADS